MYIFSDIALDERHIGRHELDAFWQGFDALKTGGPGG